MRVMLKSGFDTYTGYGNDAVDMAVWLTRAGHDVVPWPDNLLPGLPRAFTDLLTKDPGGMYDVALNFAPPFDIHPDKFAHFARTAVGWSMWEKTPLIRKDMRGHGWPRWQDRRRWWSRNPRSKSTKKDWLDLMVVTCHDNVPAFQAIDDQLPYAVVPNGIDPDRWPVLDRSGADRPFTFASIGMLNGRKDPFATLQAWQLAQELEPGFDAKLILKTATTGLHPKIAEVYRNVEIVTAVWPASQVLDFYGHVDCLVSTSRGEGNNKPAMEFMSTGGPVMATDWSGHRNWLHPDTGYPLPGLLVENSDGVSDFRVSVEATARTFIEVWKDPTTAARKGALAARTIRATLSWEKVLERLVRDISRVM